MFLSTDKHSGTVGVCAEGDYDLSVNSVAKTMGGRLDSIVRGSAEEETCRLWHAYTGLCMHRAEGVGY